MIFSFPKAIQKIKNCQSKNKKKSNSDKLMVLHRRHISTYKKDKRQPMMAPSPQIFQAQKEQRVYEAARGQ